MTVLIENMRFIVNKKGVTKLREEKSAQLGWATLASFQSISRETV